MAYKITVNKATCIGCGVCAAICPNSFEMKEGKSSPKKPKTKEITCEKTAEEACPVKAISVIEK